MAHMGLKYLAWAKIKEEPANAEPTYDGGKEIGKIVSLNVAISNSEGKLYANDQLAEYASEFAEGDLTAETDNISLEDQAAMLGATYSEQDGYVGAAGDTAPYGGVGGYQVLMVGGKKKYRAWVYPKVKAMQPNVDATTKGDSVSFGTQPIKMKVSATNKGTWIYQKEFDAEAEAKSYVNSKLGMSET